MREPACDAVLKEIHSGSSRSPRCLANWIRCVSLLPFLAVGSALNGCATDHPAPVYGWNWSGSAPKGYYRVREGDSLSVVAERVGVSVSKLAAWNGLNPPYAIFSGTLLRMSPPGKAIRRSATKPPAAASRSSQAAPGRVQSGPRDSAARGGKGQGSLRTASGIPWEWPLHGPVKQRFKEGDPGRQGIRIGGRSGDPVKASADGRVVYSGGGLKGYGNLIIIKHNDKYLTAYGFNRRLLVSEGDSVRRGQAVAEVGLGAEGTHLLHFEVRRDGTAVDPVLYLPPRN